MYLPHPLSCSFLCHSVTLHFCLFVCLSALMFIRLSLCVSLSSLFNSTSYLTPSPDPPLLNPLNHHQPPTHPLTTYLPPSTSLPPTLQQHTSHPPLSYKLDTELKT